MENKVEKLHKSKLKHLRGNIYDFASLSRDKKNSHNKFINTLRNSLGKYSISRFKH